MSAKLEDPAVAYRTRKCQSSSQFPRRIVLKNLINTGQLHSSSMLVKVMLKILPARLQHYANQELPDVQAGLQKEEEPEIKLLTFAGLQRKLGNSSKTSTSVSSNTLKPLTVWIITNCGKLLKKWEY